MRAMASDKFPRFVQKYVEWAVGLNGGGCSMRLDWFAARGVAAKKAKVVRLTELTSGHISKKLSDHHPIMLEWSPNGVA
jgi:hypothetical protein